MAGPLYRFGETVIIHHAIDPANVGQRGTVVRCVGGAGPYLYTVELATGVRIDAFEGDMGGLAGDDAQADTGPVCLCDLNFGCTCGRVAWERDRARKAIEAAQ